MGKINHHNVNRYILDNNIAYFVETGTGIGHGLHFIVRHFDLKGYFSCEIYKPLFDDLVQSGQFDSPKIHLYNLSSIEFLKTILPNLTDGNILFWLDAHYPGSDYCGVSYHAVQNMDEKLPLEKELDLIYSYRKEHSDVIICDDLRIYKEDNFENGNLPDKSIGYYNMLFLDRFKDVYSIKEDLRDEGYIIFSKK